VEGTVSVPHQAVIELVAATTRPLERGDPLLSPEEARREAKEILSQLVILYPTERTINCGVERFLP